MKKIYLILFTVFLNMALFSCTPQSITENGATETSECCGEDGDLPPPPPPPPGG